MILLKILLDLHDYFYCYVKINKNPDKQSMLYLVPERKLLLFSIFIVFFLIPLGWAEKN